MLQLQRGSPQPIIAHWWNCATRRTSPLAAFTAPPVPRMRPGSIIIIEPSRIIVSERRDARANNKLRTIDPSRATRRNTLGFFLFDGTFNANERRLRIEFLRLKSNRFIYQSSDLADDFSFSQIKLLHFEICWIAFVATKTFYWIVKSWYHLHISYNEKIYEKKLLQNFSIKSSNLMINSFIHFYRINFFYIFKKIYMHVSRYFHRIKNHVLLFIFQRNV